MANSSVCVACGEGKYASTSGMAGCSLCPAGTYVNSSGSTTCNLCTFGKYSFTGSGSCDGCPTGTYAFVAGSSCVTPAAIAVPLGVFVICCFYCIMKWVSKKRAAQKHPPRPQPPIPSPPEPQLLSQPTPALVVGDMVFNPEHCKGKKVNNCESWKLNVAFFDFLVKSYNLDERKFHHEFDRCYCQACYPREYPDIIDGDGPTAYIVPREWFRFGLRMDAQILISMRIFSEWSVSFHGTSPSNLSSVMSHGIALPGSMVEGQVHQSRNSAGRQLPLVYTSPTIKYAGLGFYARPKGFYFQNCKYWGQVVLQCRQKPGTFKKQGETMGFLEKLKQQVQCEHLKQQNEVEWVSETVDSLKPYGLVVRVFAADGPVPSRFISPVDYPGMFIE